MHQLYIAPDHYGQGHVIHLEQHLIILHQRVCNTKIQESVTLQTLGYVIQARDLKKKNNECYTQFIYLNELVLSVLFISLQIITNTKIQDWLENLKPKMLC